MLATIDTSTYGDAARLLTYANQDAGAVAEALFGALADAALSTGTTSGAAAWADSYTAVAESVTDAISSLVSALGNAALLLDVSGHNHARAEAAAAPYGLPSYALPQRSLCTVAMTGVPPVFGGNADEPSGWSIVVSHLSGYSWPGADLARLAALAAAWHRAADGLSSLTVLPTSAGEVLGMLRSPELPAAISACTRLASIARSLADDCTALGNAVSRFADEIQHQRDPIYDVVKDLATTFAMCEIGGAAASALTGPLGEWGANSYLVARIPRYIARIVALLAGLDDTLPVLRPALATTTAADRSWLTMVADTRPVVADIRTSTNVLRSELDAAATSGAETVRALSDEEVINAGWGNRRTLTRHLRDHGADVGATTGAAYVRAAQEFFQRAKAEGLPIKIDDDGVIRIFDPKSEMFASYNRDGRARTIFKPDHPTRYWAEQKGTLQ